MTAPASLYWDGYGLAAPNSGVFVHARSLANELVEAGYAPTVVGAESCTDLFRDLQTLVVHGHALARALSRQKVFASAYVARTILESRRSAAPASLNKPFILHGLSNFNIPARGGHTAMRRVLTVHDLIPLLAPKLVSQTLVLQLKLLMPRAVRNADRIVCVSHWTKQTLIAWFPEAEGKTVVIPNGVRASAAQPGKDAAKALPDASIKLLFVSRYEGYKGHSTLLNLMRHTSLPLHLTLITDAQGAAFCREHASDLIGTQKLVLRGNLYGEELTQAYRDADIYVSPSQYEGFCLPAVEAMEAGKPVVYRSGSGIDEVAGGTVNTPVEGTLVEAWDGAIRQANMRRQSPSFSAELKTYLGSLTTWKDAASRLISLYDELV